MPPTPPPNVDAPIDRRPLTSRDTAWAHAAAEFLVRAGASPNGISVAGGVFGCLAGAAFAATTSAPSAERLLYGCAAVCVQLRLLCNLFDGMVAVEGGRRSAVGELFNEAPDRVSDTATLVGAGYSLGATPAWGWAAACVALWVAYVRALAKTAGAPSDFCGPMAKQHRMALMTATAAFLAVAPAVWRPSFGLTDAALSVVVALGLITSTRRLARAAAFLRSER